MNVLLKQVLHRLALRSGGRITLGLLGGMFWISTALADPVSVRTLPLGGLLVEPQFSAPATVMPRNQPQVAAEISARVVALPVEVGDRVSEGAALARLDCRSHESRLAVARAELKVTLAQMSYAREQLKRARNLKKNESISDELLDQRRTDLEARQAETDARREAVNQAAIDVEYCEIRAPFDAVVTERLVSVGDFVSPGKVVVGLLETAGQEISASLRQNEIARLQEADELVFEAGSVRFPVRLRALLPSLDALARTREARLAFVGDTALPGTAGRLVWQGGRQLMPADYLVRRDDRLGVFVLNEGKAQFVVIPQALEGQPFEVDLPPDTHLITDGRQGLVDGEEVAVSPPREQPL